MVGFGVFFGAETKSEKDLDAIIKFANESVDYELKKIPVNGGFILGCDFLTEDDNFPAVYLERSSIRLYQELIPIMRASGVEITDDNFRVVVHNLWPTCTAAVPHTPSPRHDKEPDQSP